MVVVFATPTGVSRWLKSHVDRLLYTKYARDQSGSLDWTNWTGLPLSFLGLQSIHLAAGRMFVFHRVPVLGCR